MAYRPPHRSAAARGNGVRRHPSRASRIAIARATGRRSGGSSGTVGLIAGLLVLVIVGVMASSTVAVGGAVQATIAQMEADLPNVAEFDKLKFAESTRVFDRTGKIQLAVFQQERRSVVTFQQIPQLVLDATVATEDHSFWTNQGYDPNAIVAAALAYIGGDKSRGGASTITQQLVRARLLQPELVNDPTRTEERKFKEILQASKLTDYVRDATGGEETGKQRIITAYLNQIFYGHNAYGIAGAADVYFGKTVDQLTVAEAALLASIPKSPNCYDLYRWLPTDPETGAVVKDDQGRLVVPLTGAVPPPGCAPENATTPIVARRNSIIDALTQGADKDTGHSFGRWTNLTPAQGEAAKAEPIVLIGDRPTVFLAPHFVWAVKSQLDQLLSDREPAETGGYNVRTSLDMKAQSIAERYVTAATIVPQLSGAAFDRAIRQYKLGKDRDWISPLRGVGIHNGAMVALDYKTGDVLAYVGSAGYYRDDLASKKFNPKYDVAGVGFRQPGSAFKPVVYTTGFDQRKITAGSVLLDVTTAFASTWTPEDADSQERGPVLARKALQYSLNIPAIRALDRTGFKSVDQAAAKAGLKFQAGTSIEGAGLAGAIGTVEVRLQDLVSTYGAFGNGGVVTEPRMILDVTDSAGNSVATAGDPIQRKVWSPQAAWIMANILEGNTNPRDNLIWGPRFRLDNGPGNAYRPAAIKTGTTNEVRDVSAYGLLPKPTDPDQPAIALGVWMGNSDHRQPTLGDRLIFAADGPGEVWHSFMREYMKGKPVAEFERPKGLVEQTIDAYSGGRPGPWTRDTVSEWFINGTQPGGNDAVDPPGILYTQQCGTWMVDPVKAENRGAPAIWTNADRDWARRAARGPGVAGAYGTRTSYFWGRASWGGPITSGGPCITPPPATPTPRPTPEPTATSPDTTPGPQPTPRRTPRPRPTEPPPVATPTPEPVITPAPTCRPNGKPVGCIPVEPPPAPPADESPAADAAAAATFGLTVTAASHVSQHHQVPYGITGSIQPAILSEASSSPVRIGRRRRSVRRRR